MSNRDATTNQAFKGFTNSECPFFPCHQGVKREFNCLFCYCPLSAFQCPGPYRVFIDRHGLKRKDCSDCHLPHDGYQASWGFIQKWIEQPMMWDGREQSGRYRKVPPKP